MRADVVRGGYLKLSVMTTSFCDKSAAKQPPYPGRQVGEDVSPSLDVEKMYKNEFSRNFKAMAGFAQDSLVKDRAINDIINI